MKSFYLDPQCREVDGLRVLVLPDDSYSVTAVYSLVHVGSASEAADQAGMSHFVEHLLFKGTERRSVGSIGQEVMRAGGEVNAFTTFDYTGYTITIDSSRVELAFDIHGDVLANSSFDSAEIEKERAVILEEVKLGETSPSMILRQETFKKAFPDHPYGRPIIGFRSTVSGASRNGLVDYYRRHYCRENMTIVVAGDTDTDRVVSLIEKHFSGVSHGDPTPAPEAVPFGIGSSFTRRMKVNDAYVKMALPAVALAHDDYPALCILGLILGAGRCGRLFLNIQYPGIAHSIGFGAMPMRSSGLLTLSATCHPSRTRELVDCVRDQFENCAREAPDSEEVERARQMLIATSVYDKDTFSERASEQSVCAALATPQFDRQFVEAVQKVTPDEVLEVAGKYLKMESAVTGMILPKRALVAVDSSGGGPPEADWRVQRTVIDPGPAPSSRREGKVSRAVLDNGAVIIHLENRELPMVACRAFFLAGSVLDGQGASGLSSLTQRLMLRGAAGRSMRETGWLLESLGIDLSGFTRADDTCFYFESLTEEIDTALTLLKDAVTCPNLEDDEMARVRSDMISRVRHERDDMGAYITREGARALWGDHPYGRASSGEEEDLAAITIGDVREFHERYYRSDKMVVTMVGDISSEEAFGKAAAAFSGLKDGGEVPKLPGYTPIAEPIIFERKKSWPAGIVALSWRCPSILSDDYIPLRVLSAVLGNPFSSRIWKTVREDRGLAYMTGAACNLGTLGGAFSMYAGVSPRRITLVRKLMLEALRDIKSRPAGTEELADAKMYLTGTYNLHHQGAAQAADYLGIFEICGLGFGFDSQYVSKVNAVTADDLVRVAREHLDEENFLTLIVKPKGGAPGVLWRLLRDRLKK